VCVYVFESVCVCVCVREREREREIYVCTLPYSAQPAVLTNISAVLYVDRYFSVLCVIHTVHFLNFHIFKNQRNALIKRQ